MATPGNVSPLRRLINYGIRSVGRISGTVKIASSVVPPTAAAVTGRWSARAQCALHAASAMSSASIHEYGDLPGFALAGERMAR